MRKKKSRFPNWESGSGSPSCRRHSTQSGQDAQPRNYLAESPEFRETEASRAILNDRALEAHVRIKLRERFGVGTGVSGVEARADGGKIVLTGMAVHRVLVEDASKLAGEVSGVKEVQNRMVVVHGPRAFT